jgi:hypothetical protein
MGDDAMDGAGNIRHMPKLVDRVSDDIGRNPSTGM